MIGSVRVASSLVSGCEVSDGSDGSERLPTACVMGINIRTGLNKVRRRSWVRHDHGCKWCPGRSLALVLRRGKRSCE